MHVHLLHDIVLAPGLPWSLWALGGSGISLAFSCYRETVLGGKVDRCTQKAPEIGKTGDLSQNIVDPNG